MEDFKKIFYDKKELSNKRIGIDESNIIQGKRERKSRVFND